MIDLKKFYFQNVQESDYHYKFYDIIKNVNVGYNVFNGYEERDDYEFEVYDTEEAISIPLYQEINTAFYRAGLKNVKAEAAVPVNRVFEYTY